MDKLKLTLSIAALLLIGFSAGFMTNRAMVKSEMEKVVRTRPGQGFSERLIHHLKLSHDQEKKIKPIMDDFSNKMHENYRQSKLDKKLMVDQLKDSLKVHLDSMQIDAFEHFFHSMKKHHRRDSLDRKKRRQQQVKKEMK